MLAHIPLMTQDAPNEKGRTLNWHRGCLKMNTLDLKGDLLNLFVALALGGVEGQDLRAPFDVSSTRATSSLPRKTSQRSGLR